GFQDGCFHAATMAGQLAGIQAWYYPRIMTATPNELGDFLRSRRTRLSPKTVGLPAGRRRRTPGLRREEVAELAGIGVDWYIRLEQGRSA
ncbi:helix-turn-helix domain-containing protein, partial [Enterococcus casseliflavus]|uniref:helix-turn-helix domain-containing protein n=1 Tax=Enterococcus casseliflavus TaxID=37734 RepID=UPI003D0EF0DC